MNSLVPVAFAAMAAAALLLPTAADRWRAAFGLPAFLLGVASIPHLPDFQGPSLTVWISAGLLALGPAPIFYLKHHIGPSHILRQTTSHDPCLLAK
jgi:hypothetical protein